MPIKPENKALYPAGKEWKAIRAEVLERAGDRCEWPGCGVPNGQLGLRDVDGKWWPFEEFAGGRVPDEVVFEADGETPRKGFKIALTMAHKDHDPRNNGEAGNRPNLAAWCQYHHLKYDAHHHAKNARKTRDAKKGQETLL